MGGIRVGGHPGSELGEGGPLQHVPGSIRPSRLRRERPENNLQKITLLVHIRMSKRQ